MNVMVVDSEKAFAANLACRLKRLLPEFQVFGLAGAPECLAVLDCSAASGWLVLYNREEFPGIPEQIARLDLAVPLEFWSILPAVENGQSEATQTFCRFGSVRELAGRIKSIKAVSEHGIQCQARERAGPDPDLQPEESSVPAMLLLLSVYPSGYQPDFSRQRLGELVGSGRRIIYLPLMPTYQMACVASPGRGPSLSDLLLQLLGQNIQPSQLSLYWQPHPAGYLQFRPPDRSDDLVLCSPDILRQLAVMLREKIAQEPDPCTVLIDCAGLPLASVAAVAVLCDQCEIGFPEDGSFASESAKNEVGQLLAKLPASCKIREIRPAVNLRSRKQEALR